MRILVTGGAGFIGSHFVRSALSDRYPTLVDAEIVVVDKLTYAGNLANLEPVKDHARLRFVQGDILDAALVDDVMSGIDIVIHFAAESHVDRSIIGAGTFVTTNVVGTQILFDAALRKHIARFHHVSTDEVYGSITRGAWPETDPLQPNSPYAASKASGDLLARAYFQTYRLHVTISRCSNNYGPYQFPEKLIPLFVTNLLDGRKVPLYGDGRHVRDWLHVDDHCQGIVSVLHKGRPGEIYNIGGGTELSNRELTALLLKATGRDWDSVEQVPDRKGHDRRYCLDITKASTELGYSPRIPFDKGLADTIRWYQQHRDWWEPLKERAALSR
jgi:dTDP-glucose 4,6-dehydratase